MLLNYWKTTLLICSVFLIVKTTTILSCETEVPIKQLKSISGSYDNKDILKNKIYIKWKFYCSLQQKFVNNFTIEYFRLPDCSNGTKITLKNYNHTSFILTQLEADSIYRIYFSSPQIAEKYEIFGRADIREPDMPTRAQLTFPIAKDDAVNLDFPVLSWDLPWPITQPSSLSYFSVNVSEFESGTQIYMSDKIDTSVNNNGLSTCKLSKMLNNKLTPAKKYSLDIQCCNWKRQCSPPFELASQMPPRRPGWMNSPSLLKLSNSSYQLSLLPPTDSNGPIDGYYVQQKVEYSESSTEMYFSKNAFEAQNLEIHVNCSDYSTLGWKTFLVSYAAVNIERIVSTEKNGNFTSRKWIGPYSDPSRIELCYSEENAVSHQQAQKTMFTTLVISITVIVGTCITFLVFYFIYNAAKYIKNVKEKMQKLEIKVLSNEQAATAFYVEQQFKVNNSQLFNQTQKLENDNVKMMTSFSVLPALNIISKIKITEATDKKYKNEEKFKTKQLPAFSISTGYTCLPNIQTKF